MRRYSVPLSVCLAVVVLAVALRAGPLDPPAGPITPTYKTLTEVEPRIAINAANTPGDADSLFRITQPGSYYLTGNVTGVTGKSGIEVGTNNVNIDLRGFTVRGVPGSLSGITSAGVVLTAVHVHDGSVLDWAVDGVVVLGSSHLFARLAATNNSGRGIVAAFGSFESCSATTNGGHGFNGSDHCRFTGCTSRGNGGNGFTANQNSVFERCVAGTNTGAGISLASGVVTDCTTALNGGSGIVATSEATIQGCQSRANTIHGISIALGCTITACSVGSNGASGIVAASGSIVSKCTANANSANGIQFGNDCHVFGNQCDSNGVADGAGIHATGSDNRIEGNNCTDADRGIDVDAAGNIIVRNTCSGNTSNWEIVIGNSIGAIVTAGTNPTNISGSNINVASSLNSTDPYANFSY